MPDDQSSVDAVAEAVQLLRSAGAIYSTLDSLWRAVVTAEVVLFFMYARARHVFISRGEGATTFWQWLPLDGSQIQPFAVCNMV